MFNYFKVERVKYNIMLDDMSKRKRDDSSVKSKRIMSPVMGHNQIRMYVNWIIGRGCTYTRTRRMQTCKMIRICIGREYTYTRTRKMQICLLIGRFCKTSNLRIKSEHKNEARS
ncbi:hypothetical protein HanIR_Chr07g0336631 [Helianthus annuus]|nr:hypothetical protein HanIR_Chr07g0336631 [Helianthus annuus]